MNEVLERLRDLQRTDTEILRVRRRIKAGPEAREQARLALGATRAAVAEKEAAMRQAQAEADEADLEAKRIETEINRLKDKLSTIKNNKEYTILRHGIDEAAQRRSAQETTELEHLELVDTLRQERDALAAQAQEAQQELDRISAEVDAEQKELHTRQDELRDKREAQARVLDQEVLEDYERVLRSGRGVAIVPMLNGACQGCFRKLTPNLENQILVGNTLVRCQGCGRFLYCEDGPPEE